MGEAPRETVILAFAAEVAYRDLVAGTALPGRQVELLDLLAFGIALDATVHGVEAGGTPRLLARGEVFAGRFTAGATRFEFYDGRAALGELRVVLDELPRALRRAIEARRRDA